MFGALVRQSGVAQANSAIVGPNGEIRLVATKNVTLDAGSVTSASGDAQGGTVQVSAPVVVQAGDVRADGDAGGNIQVDATNFLQAGTLSASGGAGDGGTIAVSAPHVIQTASAVMAADGRGSNGGSISVDASGAQDGLLFSSATYSATGDKGGTIKLLGHDILLLGASADASGATGGGTILVGGDFHGGNAAVPNASTTGVNFSTTLKANATTSGDGGKIVIWSDDNTQFYGTASARGGASNGNGGSMEISGANNLTMGGIADAGATNGTPGSLLLDPKNIVIDSNTGGTGTLGFFQLLDPNPVAGNGFGTKVVVLPNQNVVVTAPDDNFGAAGAGAVFMYNVTTGGLISALTGSSANDHVGSNPTTPITTLPSGNFVVLSPQWNGNEGAVTLVNGTSGLTGTVSAANSLVGSTAGDAVGQRVIDVLTNGNYVVSTPNWTNAGATAAGAVTFVNGTNGNIANTASPGGTVSATNSLVGTTANDQVGSNSLTPLFNGNYLVISPNWNNGAATQAGAATLINGTNGNIVATGTPGGAVSSANSLVGTTTNDHVGSSFALPLGGGAYLVFSPQWNNGAATQAGAVTFGNATTGVAGPVSATNSLVGSTATDQVGSFGAQILNNGNYLVFSPSWNNGGSVPLAGAVTMGTLTAGVSGPVSAANSLVGTSQNDQVGRTPLIDLGNGNVLITTPTWTNPTNGNANAGAVTFVNDTTGVTGAITPTNSLVGTNAQDFVGTSVFPLGSSHNYVVISPNWNGGMGAVTFGNGTTGVVGQVSATNSLVGTTAGDQVGSGFITELPNGNYVVSSPTWTQPAGAAPQVNNVGAVTWVDGTNGNIFGTGNPGGTISAANSLVGVTASDSIGSAGVVGLANGNYVVISPNWVNPQTGAVAAGAVTWVPSTGAAGQITPANSLVGTSPNDQVGSNFITQLTNGNYVVKSPEWNGTLGAATLVNGTNGNIASSGSAAGSVSATNSLVGSTAGDNVGLVVTTLTNGNYVVASPNWTNPGTQAAAAGAVTFGDGTTGVVGAVSSTNSLVGTAANDQVGTFVMSLSNGNYVVESNNWNGGAGAVTFGNGTTGIAGAVSATNSLVGSTAGDHVGQQLIPLFSSGNYVVISQSWNGGRGAVTFGNGTTGVTGVVSSSNSLVGSTPDTTTTGDHVGSQTVEQLPNGNYLVLSPNWNNGAAVAAGALTWVNGTNGNVFGQSSPGAVVSATNSLVGTTQGDGVGHVDTDCSSDCARFTFIPSSSGTNVTLLNNTWTNPASGAASAGAVTYINAAIGVAGPISSANSIIGAGTGDEVGSGGIIPLGATGNFIVASPSAANGALANAGLVQIVTPGTSGGGGAPATGQTFSSNPGSDVTITPASIIGITNTGTALTLQANNDITLNANSDIVTSAGGAGGALTLQAGRSVALNSIITTDNGALTIVANERVANGVIDANRDPGAATIAMAPGTTINAGTANISLMLNDGAGLTNPTSGNITLANLITGGAVSVQNLGPTAGSGIVNGSGTVQGATVALSAPKGAIGSPALALAVNTLNISAAAANGIAINLNASAPAAATISALNNTTTGDIVLTAHGGATFPSLVTNPGGSVTINSFSPLDVQQGITAGNSIFLSTNGAQTGSANDMQLAGTYTYDTTAGTFEVTIGRGGDLTLFTASAPPLVLTQPLFPNPMNITSFTFVPSDPLADPIVAAAYNTTIAPPSPAPQGADEKKDKSDQGKKGAAVCR
jgi:hypothetical protein